MTTAKDRFARWPRNSHSKKEEHMSTEQLEQNELNEAMQTNNDANPETPETGSELDQLRAERDQLALQLTQAQDRLARLQAEFDNTRKREAKERQDVRDYAIQSAVEPFLGVLDNFSLALKSEGDVAQLRTGVQLIVKQMEDALRGLNVQPVEAVGAQFDPRIHEALGSIETLERPDHQVLEEIRRGYKLRDKLLRPALVRIASNSAQKSE
ncbi:MAG: nucleotide exchange factor GrpE [Acidobacteriaceae bacterium]